MVVSKLVELLVRAMHEGLDPNADVLTPDRLPTYLVVDREQATVYITDVNPEEDNDAESEIPRA